MLKKNKRCRPGVVEMVPENRKVYAKIKLKPSPYSPVFYNAYSISRVYGIKDDMYLCRNQDGWKWYSKDEAELMR